jgi:hypothetical protein
MPILSYASEKTRNAIGHLSDFVSSSGFCKETPTQRLDSCMSPFRFHCHIEKRPQDLGSAPIRARNVTLKLDRSRIFVAVSILEFVAVAKKGMLEVYPRQAGDEIREHCCDRVCNDVLP